MFTRAEKGYLALTLAFLAAGSGIKAYRHASARLGPFPDPGFGLSQAAAAPDSLSGTFPDSGSAAADSASAGAGVNDSSRTGTGDGAGSGEAVQDGRRRPVPGAGKSAFAGKVDLNRAEAAELTRVKGIGAKTAEAIIRYRRDHGPFRDLRDLLQVKGIGEKKLEKLRPFLIL
ncbi:MAG TPA: helix-hairpin-helix domain-containing protein [Fibrobacteria bacterium]|nr:helix-hairpin-helix domain-containing protein [Fibrobacteria bacterium]